MKMNLAIPVVALLAGAAIGYVLKPAPKAAEPEPKGEQRVRKGQIVERDGASENALRARVRELERELAALAAGNASGKVEENNERRGGMAGAPTREEMRANFEKWKQENPEEWERMEKRRQEFLKRRQERAQSKMDFLASIDTSTMSKKAKETHERLQRLIAQREELETKLHADMANMSDEDREHLFREMHETDDAIRETNSQERENLLQQTAEALGFSGAEATEIVDTIGEIYEATSSHFGRPGGPGGPGGGRGGRGGRRGGR